MKKLSMFQITFVVFAIVNILAAVALYVTLFQRPFNPSSVQMTKMFLGSLFASTVLFTVIAKLSGRKQFWQR